MYGIAVEGPSGDELSMIFRRSAERRRPYQLGQQDEVDGVLPSASVSASILVVMWPWEWLIAWFCVPLLRPDRGDGL